MALLLFFAIPFGLSVNGCKKALAVNYCNGGDSGPEVGQVATITLSPNLATYGESLAYGQIGQSLSASATDCKGNSVSVSGGYTYASSNIYNPGNVGAMYADINPTTGQVCAGSWNRHVGGGVPDYSTCTPPTVTPSTYLAYVTASANGAVSNAIPIYVHPTATSVIVGTPTPTTGCAAALQPGGDPSSNCCPLFQTAPGNPQPYVPNVCLSQGQTAQLSARVYANGSTTPANNITCQVGHITFAPIAGANVLSIDENGVVTANQPGSAIITASTSTSGSASNAGFFSTCPPTSIVLSAAGKTGSNISVDLNNAQPLSAVVTDKNGVVLTGVNLEFNSTTPQTITTSSNSVTPVFPGTASITAVCLPGTCNASPYSEIGYLGNGTPLTSNNVNITAAGTSSTVLFIGSTSSQYLYPQDFTTNQRAGLIKLPYTPNSMVINQAGTQIYLGSSQALMTVSATSNAVSSANTQVTGSVLAVSPDGNTLVLSDPARKLVSLYNTGGSTTSTYGGTATQAQFTPDSQTVYIIGADPSGNPQVLIHSNFSSWTAIPLTTPYTGIAVTVPAVGAYFAAGTFTDGRSYCPNTTVNTGANPPTTTNSFYPLADTKTVKTDQLAATTDGAHILGATAATPATLNDIAVTFPSQTVGGTTTFTACPQAPAVIAPGYFTSSVTAHPLTAGGITAIPTSITGVVPSSNSAAAFVTYLGTASNSKGELPLYLPGTGTLSFVPLSGTATAPVAGVFSTDNFTFYVGTAGDNQVHTITLTYPTSGAAATATDTGVLTPALPDANGNIVTPNLLVQRPKKATN